MLIWYPLESTTGKICMLISLMKNCCLNSILIDDVCHSSAVWCTGIHTNQIEKVKGLSCSSLKLLPMHQDKTERYLQYRLFSMSV